MVLLSRLTIELQKKTLLSVITVDLCLLFGGGLNNGPCKK